MSYDKSSAPPMGPYYAPGPPHSSYPQPPPAYSAQSNLPQPMGAAAYHAPPPSYGANNAPTPVGASQTNKKKSGLFGTLGAIVNDVGRGIDSAARSINDIAERETGTDLLHSFNNNYVIQLAYPPTSTAMEIVMGPNGSLIIDARGPLDRNAYHAHWTVAREVNTNIVRLHNRENFISVVNHAPGLGVVPAASPAAAPPSTRFRVRQSNGQISLESMSKPAHYIVVDPKTLQLELKEVSILNQHSFFNLYIVFVPH